MSNLQTHSCDFCPSRNNGIFCDVDPNEKQFIDQAKIPHEFNKNHEIFVQGEEVDGLYCIKAGNVKIFKRNAEGKESILRIATGGDIIGHRSFFSHQSYQATAIALDTTQVCFIEGKKLNALMRLSPAISIRIMQKLSKELGISEQRLASVSQKTIFQRTCEVLVMLKESHGAKDKEGIKINLKLSRLELAELVGVAPENLSRIIGKLKSENIIKSYQKYLTILNYSKLEHYAELCD